MVRLLRPARESNALAEREQLQRIVPRPEISAFQYSAFGEVGNGAGMKVFGAGDGIRTRDINLGKVALYQLSYSRTVGVRLLSRPRWINVKLVAPSRPIWQKRSVSKMFRFLNIPYKSMIVKDINFGNFSSRSGFLCYAEVRTRGASTRQTGSALYRQASDSNLESAVDVLGFPQAWKTCGNFVVTG